MLETVKTILCDFISALLHFKHLIHWGLSWASSRTCCQDLWLSAKVYLWPFPLCSVLLKNYALLLPRACSLKKKQQRVARQALGFGACWQNMQLRGNNGWAAFVRVLRENAECVDWRRLLHQDSVHSYRLLITVAWRKLLKQNANLMWMRLIWQKNILKIHIKILNNTVTNVN